MVNKVSISILGIGTELTSGQILNRNAQWISQKMSQLGADCNLHMVVPDERQMILKALDQCAQHSNMIFITGGLGPTSDDFTREVIADWTGQELLWDQGSWEHLTERLNSRAIPVKEIQRQQCYFPRGAKVLTNQMGTANGFSLTFQGKEVFVLPGPPREIEAIWNDWIAPVAEQKCQDIDAVIVKSWDTMGYGESQIAELAEAALQGCAYERGYRVHLPYVEFKLTYRKSQSSEAQKWCDQVTQALFPVTILRDGEDIAQILSEKLEVFSAVQIIDNSNGGFLLKRIFPFTKNILQQSRLLMSNNSVPSSSELTLQLLCQGHNNATAKISYLGFSEELPLSSPFKAQLLAERSHQYFAEKALVFFTQKIEAAQKIAKV